MKASRPACGKHNEWQPCPRCKTAKARRVMTAETIEGDGPIEDGPWFDWWLSPGTPAWSEMADIVESLALSEDAIGNPCGRIP